MAMPYTRSHRSAFLFIFLGVLTLGIYDVVVMTKIREEVETLMEGKSFRRLLPPVAVYILGWLTLGIAPLIWAIRLSAEVEILALERGLGRPPFSARWFGLWASLGALILVGPFIALTRLIRTLNRVEQAENEYLKSKEKEVLDEEESVPEEEKPQAKEEKEEPPLRYRVRYGDSSEPIRSFDSQEEALAYAHRLEFDRAAERALKQRRDEK